MSRYPAKDLDVTVGKLVAVGSPSPRSNQGSTSPVRGFGRQVHGDSAQALRCLQNGPVAHLGYRRSVWCALLSPVCYATAHLARDCVCGCYSPRALKMSAKTSSATPIGMSRTLCTCEEAPMNRSTIAPPINHRGRDTSAPMTLAMTSNQSVPLDTFPRAVEVVKARHGYRSLLLMAWLVDDHKEFVGPAFSVLIGGRLETVEPETSDKVGCRFSTEPLT